MLRQRNLEMQNAYLFQSGSRWTGRIAMKVSSTIQWAGLSPTEAHSPFTAFIEVAFSLRVPQTCSFTVTSSARSERLMSFSERFKFSYVCNLKESPSVQL